jgi:hypothetical protein
VITLSEDKTGRLANFQRQFRGNHAIGQAANAVGSKVATNHETPPTPTLLIRTLTSLLLMGRQAGQRSNTNAKTVKLRQKSRGIITECG